MRVLAIERLDADLANKPDWLVKISRAVIVPIGPRVDIAGLHDRVRLAPDR